MTRQVAAVFVALVVAGDIPVSAAQWSAKAGATQPPTPPPISTQTPAAGSRFTSTLTWRGRHAEPSRRPRPLRDAVFVPAFPFVWGWGAAPFYAGVPLVSTPPLDDAPVGGVQLDVVPWRARVYVDGVPVGKVDDFKGYYHHLTVASGPHQIVIVEPGYQPLVLDVVVPAGRTTTYRGALSEALNR
jgi:hypothetical protein